MEQILYWYILSEITGHILLYFFRVKQDRCYAWVAAVMAAIAIASAIQKGVQAGKQNKLANAIKPDDPTYKPSEFAKANLGLASSLFNGRMAGAAEAERNIAGTQSNTIGQINRNATSSSQALALAASTQGEANDSFGRLSVAEAQNKQSMAGQLYNANRDMTIENNKVYEDLQRKYNNDVQAKAALRQAAANNTSGIYSDLASGVFAAGSMQGSGFGSGGWGQGYGANGSALPSANVGGRMALPGTGFNTSPGNFAAPGQLQPMY
ncbi:MAG: hypothetical protein WKF91_23275, partial [Segetibacter sp.]